MNQANTSSGYSLEIENTSENEVRLTIVGNNKKAYSFFVSIKRADNKYYGTVNSGSEKYIYRGLGATQDECIRDISDRLYIAIGEYENIYPFNLDCYIRPGREDLLDSMNYIKEAFTGVIASSTVKYESDETSREEGTIFKKKLSPNSFSWYKVVNKKAVLLGTVKMMIRGTPGKKGRLIGAEIRGGTLGEKKFSREIDYRVLNKKVLEFIEQKEDKDDATQATGIVDGINYTVDGHTDSDDLFNLTFSFGGQEYRIPNIVTGKKGNKRTITIIPDTGDETNNKKILRKFQVANHNPIEAVKTLVRKIKMALQDDATHGETYRKFLLQFEVKKEVADV